MSSLRRVAKRKIQGEISIGIYVFLKKDIKDVVKNVDGLYLEIDTKYDGITKVFYDTVDELEFAFCKVYPEIIHRLKRQKREEKPVSIPTKDCPVCFGDGFISTSISVKDGRSRLRYTRDFIEECPACQ